MLPDHFGARGQSHALLQLGESGKDDASRSEVAPCPTGTALRRLRKNIETTDQIALSVQVPAVQYAHERGVIVRNGFEPHNLVLCNVCPEWTA